MSITAIKREFNLFPNIVGIVTTDNLATITTNGYFFGTQGANVELLNNGIWEWEPEDIVLIYYSADQIGFFTYNSTTDAFLAVSSGSLSSTLASSEIFVGNASNIATGVAMSGDATISNTGALTVASGVITGSKIASNAVDYAQLAADVGKIAVVNLTSAQIKALYDTPVQLVAAPGVGKLVLIDSIFWAVGFGTTQYAAGGAIAAQYGNSAHGAGPLASGTLAAASLNAVAASGFLSNNGFSQSLAVASSASLNTAVYISNQTGDFTTGDSTAILYVRYKIVTPF